jgi:mRNA interferase RelE/StbE
VSNSVTWEPAALQQAEHFPKDDPQGIGQVFNTADLLADDPRPVGSTGGNNVRRIRIGAYRLMYRIDDGPPVMIAVEHLGRRA